MGGAKKSCRIFETYFIYSLAKIWTQKEDGPRHLNRRHRLRDKQQRMHQRDFENMNRNLFRKRNHQKILMAYGSTHGLMLMRNSHRKLIYTFNQRENMSRLTTFVYISTKQRFKQNGASQNPLESRRLNAG